ncbi:MAG: DEAD/DEAH box helicase [Crenarchaeota archaeon]|nr:DEAD/DEAH box helicase [Thermoproteota archaeon]
MLKIFREVSADSFLRELSSDSARSIVYIYVEHPVEPEYGPPVEEACLPRGLVELLKRRGIERFLKYQWEAYQHIVKGEDVVIVSGTGTGKTEAFILPIIHVLSRDPPDARGICLIMYPTKALARDQYVRIREYVSAADMRVEVYDGDTPEDVRRRIYAEPPEILLTNPDMLHYALMYVDKFRSMLPRVRFVVLDDFHMYEGVFGTHVHYVLRRLSRFCNKLQYVATSATIGNPEEFASLMFRRSCKVIRGVTGRRGLVKHLLLKSKRTKIQEAVELVKLCVRSGKRGIVFADSHRLVELIKRLLDRAGLGSLVAVHRAGLRPEERAEIEDKFREGKLIFIIATPTLEIGIDIGNIDIAIMATVPPSYIRYLQRSGRVGRRGQVSYVIQILGNDPISSYFENYPEEFYNRSPEPLYIDPRNVELARLHILAMCEDAPIKLTELDDFEYCVAMSLVDEGLLRIVHDKYLYLTEEGRRVVRRLRSLRGMGDKVEIYLKDSKKKIGERELPIAIRELFPGAIYLHGGRTYKVVELKLDERRAYVVRIPDEEVNYITIALYTSIPHIERVVERGNVLGISYQYVELTIEERVEGYIVKDMYGSRIIREEYLDEEISYRFRTKGLILYMPLISFSRIEPLDHIERAKAYHAVEHALIIASQISIGAGQTDLGGISYPTGEIVIYDGHLGGSGLCRQLANRLRETIEIAYKIVKNCKCYDGCPKCIFSPYCGNNNKYLSRRNAARVLEHVLKGERAVERELPIHVKGYV